MAAGSSGYGMGGQFARFDPVVAQYNNSGELVLPGSAGLYMLQSIAAGSTGFSEFADDIDDPALRALIFEQHAWLSVDVIDAAVDQDCRRFIGKVLAELVPADSAILADPDRRTAIRFDEQVRGQLAHEELPGRLRRI